LKKRTKKLLLLGAWAMAVPHPPTDKNFFASFFAKKEALSSSKGSFRSC
jgi:hypothetical protein